MEENLERPIWKAAIIGLVITGIEFSIFASVMQGKDRSWHMELFLLLAMPVAAIAGLIAGAIFMRHRPLVESLWIIPIATSPLLFFATELAR